ncbi:sensor histidine kinase [Lachnospiraceae bacterium KM106-2]|nr:sensor histidine kinase [Lachnospiraceae bacterium KM106-2]
MDWLEEQYLRVKAYFTRSSLIKSLIFYCLTGMVSAVILSLFVNNICSSWLAALLKHYKTAWYYSNGGLGYEVLGIPNGVKKWIYLCLYIKRYSLVVNLVIMQILSITLCYKQKMKSVFQAINEQMNYIKAGDYSHQIAIQGENELEQLSGEVDLLCKLLLEEKRQRWNEDEEQRTVNAAFAHDIRTPLTVIKGYTEFLLKYIPEGKVSEEKLLEKLSIMQAQEIRLFEFSKTMTTIQAMEKWELKCKNIGMDELIRQIDQSINGVKETTTKRIEVDFDLEEKQDILLDEHLVLEVMENLMNNAIRYATEQIHILIEEKDSFLWIHVSDDGPGFSTNALRHASEVYFSEADKNSEHFGIGLTIARMLCKKHKGNLYLINGVESGAICSGSIYISR